MSEDLQFLANISQVIALLIAIAALAFQLLAWLNPNARLSLAPWFRVIRRFLPHIVVAAVFFLLGTQVAPLLAQRDQFSVADYQISRDKVCGQISIAPQVKRLTMPAPTAEDIYAGVAYELKAPAETGIHVLFHKAQHLMYDGTREVEIIMGKHFSYDKTYVPAGRSEILQDGVLLGIYDTENAKKYKTVLVTQRLTFHVVSDDGIYCEKASDDLEIEMSGLGP